MPLITYCIVKSPPLATLILKFVVLLAIFCQFSNAMRQQSVGAKGRLSCGGKPASEIKVKLIDLDTGPDPDDELAQCYTDSNGSFKLQGDTRELTNIDPQIRIYHNCSSGINLCPVEWTISIPDKYITFGQIPTEIFDLGDVNLEVELEGQRRDCIH